MGRVSQRQVLHLALVLSRSPSYSVWSCPFVLYTDDERGPVCYYVMLLSILMVIHERNSF